ncbi:hypothetical protein AAEO56_18760 [Flavobacterium sp. DGU11]|uniref:Uncharacterized protein n=1 Tax=Flavobacterium arundinis TaxID=3139143 RepID=A0ABU9I1L3_9FLAO
MNIYALKGHKVRCSDLDNGYEYQQEIARRHLVLGEVYTIDKTEVGSSSTKVMLQEVPGVFFNSVFFDDVVPQGQADDKAHPDYWRYN